MNEMKIGERIKQYRLEQGITQAELAHRIKVSPQHISQYERGLRNPKIETLQTIANALKIKLDDLLGITPLKKKGSFGTDAMQTSFALSQFLREIGFYTEGIIEGEPVIFVDSRSGSRYQVNIEDLVRMENSIESYTKFQISELISKAKKLN